MRFKDQTYASFQLVYFVPSSKSNLFSSQEPLCPSEKIECVKNIQVDTAGCLKPCTGFIVNSLYKSELSKDLENLFPVFEAYNNYKKITPYPSEGQREMKISREKNYQIFIYFRLCVEKQS